MGEGDICLHCILLSGDDLVITRIGCTTLSEIFMNPMFSLSWPCASREGCSCVIQEQKILRWEEILSTHQKTNRKILRSFRDEQRSGVIQKVAPWSKWGDNYVQARGWFTTQEATWVPTCPGRRRCQMWLVPTILSCTAAAWDPNQAREVLPQWTLHCTPWHPVGVACVESAWDS